MSVRSQVTQRALECVMSRREAAKLVAAAGVVAVTVPVTARRASAEGEVTLFTWAGYDIPDIIPAYIEKYGGPPNYGLFGEEEEALQKMRAGYTPDLAHPCVNSVGRWRDSGMFEAFDTNRLSNWPDVWPSLQSIQGTVYDGQNWFIPFDWGNSSILYRTDMVDVDEESWSILLDDRYKGKMAVFDSVDAVAGITGLLIGAENPFAMNDEQLVRAHDVLKQINANLRFWWTDQSMVEQALASGELVASYTWNDAVVNLKQQGLPVKYMNPKEGIFTWVCGLMKHAQGPGDDAAAYDLVNAMLDPRAGQFLIDSYGYGHSNKKSFDLVSPERLAELGISDPSQILEGGVFFDQIPPETRERLITMFEEVKAGM